MARKQLLDRPSIETHQLAALRKLIAALSAGNQFYQDKLRAAELDADISTIGQFTQRMPLTTKQQIIEDQLNSPPYGTNLTFPLDRYTRFCQTSGTTDKPMRWLDTNEGWQWMLDNWAQVYDAAGVGPCDRALFAFSFGPFLGFWTAFDSAVQLGLMCIPGGGMSSNARLRMIRDNKVTILFCTPTYAIRLGQVAAENDIDLTPSKVRRIIVAGEPGGSLPATRSHIERLWPGARVFDQHGMTEVGPVSFENPDRPGVLHVIESAYLAEVIDPETEQPVVPGQTGELVLTTLGRTGSPLLRYRTGDLAQPSTIDPQTLGRPELALEGGILGRTDDMLLIRGASIFPSAVEQIVRAQEEVAEYRVEILEGMGLTEMQMMVEPTAGCVDPQALCHRLGAALRDAFQLRVPVRIAQPGQLPRFEMKAQRWVRRREAGPP